jgi:Tail tubular protein
MASPSYATSTELDAVNSILMSVGESPVNTLDTQSPEVAIAQNTLRQVCREIQSEGWVFNTEYEYPFQVDSSDEVIIPPTVLQLDLNRYQHADNYDVIRRDGKLYDRYSHSYKFPNIDTLYCDVVWFFEFQDIPQVFRDYITARAARIAGIRMVSDAETTKLLEADEALARALVLEYDTKQADYSIFNSSDLRNPYTSYKPFQALSR